MSLKFLFVILGGADSLAKCWVTEFGDCTRQYKGHKHSVICMKFNRGVCTWTFLVISPHFTDFLARRTLLLYQSSILKMHFIMLISIFLIFFSFFMQSVHGMWWRSCQSLRCQIGYYKKDIPRTWRCVVKFVNAFWQLSNYFTKILSKDKWHIDK